MYQLAKAIIAVVGIAALTFCAVVVMSIKSYNTLVSAGVDPATAGVMTMRGGGLRCLVALLGCWLFLCLLYQSLWDATVRIVIGMIGR